MLARIIDSQVVWPYTIDQLRADFNCSPRNGISDEELAADFGVVRVAVDPMPEVDHTKNVRRLEPTQEGGAWVQRWAVEDASQGEIEQRVSDLAAKARLERDALIADAQNRVDRALRRQRMSLDHEDISALDAYIQALADVPQQPGFPATIIWPATP